jgi:hypothetical protein
MRHRILGVLACAPLAAGPAIARSDITIDASAVIIESPDAPGPVKEAANDLAGDMEKVLGKRPQIVSQSDGPSIEIAGPGGGATECFSIAARGNHVVLSGADMRGTIFAIYTFSQDFLGVDPMYYWNDHQPARRAKVVVPAGLSKIFRRRFSGIAAFSSMTKIS